MNKQPYWVTQLVMLALTAGIIIFMVTTYLNGVVGNPTKAQFRDVGGFLAQYAPAIIGFIIVGGLIIAATHKRKK